MLSYISPSFDAELLFKEEEQTPAIANMPVLSDEQYKAVLDEIGNISDMSIKGIDGMKLQTEGMETFNLTDYITFESFVR